MQLKQNAAFDPMTKMFFNIFERPHSSNRRRTAQQSLDPPVRQLTAKQILHQSNPRLRVRGQSDWTEKKYMYATRRTRLFLFSGRSHKRILLFLLDAQRILTTSVENALTSRARQRSYFPTGPTSGLNMK